MGNIITCPTQQLLTNWDFSNPPGWTFTGPGWAIIANQMVYTAVNDGDTVHQNWPYVNGRYQRCTMSIAQMDIAGWFFFTQAINHLGQYTEIFQTNEPQFPINYTWTGALGGAGDKMIFDWFSQVDLGDYLICKYNLLVDENSKFELYDLSDGTFMIVWGNIENDTGQIIIYDPTEDDYPF